MYKLHGLVQEGERKGRALGFPTINIPLTDRDLSGIFAAKVIFDVSKIALAAVYANQARRILEAHLLDFDGDLYGREVEIDLLEKIREDRTFDNEAALKAAIEQDIAKVQKYFKN